MFDDMSEGEAKAWLGYFIFAALVFAAIVFGNSN